MKARRIGIVFGAAVAAAVAATGPAAAREAIHNVILFVPDGLRAAAVDPVIAPAFAEVRDSGVNFSNPHSIYPTFTTVNAAALATGHYPGDTGEFANTLYPGFVVANAGATVTPFMESNDIIHEVSGHFGGNFLNEMSLIAAARAKGYSTAAVGKLGPVAFQDVSARGKTDTVIIDDDTGNGGWPLADDVKAAITAAGLAKTPPGRASGTPSSAQQTYYTSVVTKVLLPRFKAARKPFFLVYWSRDPDATQHQQQDSSGALAPGINGPSSFAAITDTDAALKALRAALKAQGLADTTDIIVSADHGFSTISKESKTSRAAKISREETVAGELPSGFVAIDLALALKRPLFDPDRARQPVRIKRGELPKRGNGLIGRDPERPELIVAANGGSDVIYILADDKPAVARKVVKSLLAQDYVGGLFADESLGEIPGTLSLGAVGLKGSALLPTPAIFVSFRSFDTGCGNPLRCAVSIADSRLTTGQGMHGTISRADTANFQAAIGPSFKRGFVDTAPSSNADVAMTIAKILKLDLPHKGALAGRVLTESFRTGDGVEFEAKTLRGQAAGKLVMELRYQTVGTVRYFDAAGFPGRTVGLAPETMVQGQTAD